MKFWIIYILVQVSFFGGLFLGRFSQCFFLIFRRRSTMVSDIFTQPSTTATTTIKKLPMTLLTQYVKR